ncbi:cyclic nucleotide-binding domain-containing protein [Marivibrio halodurans]|uniref:Cyclic nucleotide-binding domain-containing protein n=1 Tax=Marivibrio halodurans TaxID=2039722 RepID=A0A8J7V3V5_9PROT|nr:cyclic nucleotide-binding domain-containing protein [Marivibrio halodurans]MBP5858701.1 cyclic nucleotide-binding domain-containing protein [Marivibrio halodurans]
MLEGLFEPMFETDHPMWVDLIGYVAGAITLLSMHRKTMIPLRAGAILGNASFLTFGLVAGIGPTALLHAILLPLNALRLWQMLRLVRTIRREHEGESFGMEALLPYMRVERRAAGDVLFRRGDGADSMYMIESGTVRLVEIDFALSDGALIGEIAFFTPERARTVTAVCATDCTLHCLGNQAMLQLYYQNPKFGLYLMRVIVERLLRNWEAAEARAAPVSDRGSLGGAR